MRTHAEILDTGPHAIARLIQPHVDADEITLQKRVRAWAVTGSIPGEYWALLERVGVATVDELARAAAARKGVALPANDTSSQEAAA